MADKPMLHVSASPRRLRRLTPLPFARYLLQLVRERYQCERVAVLWVDERSQWWTLRPDVQCWSITHDAWLYAGPWPVICHPPCGRWGKLWRFSRQPITDGLMAMELVHRWGGIVEQPVGSALFRAAGRGGEVVTVYQCDWGHKCQKPTLLYHAPRTTCASPVTPVSHGDRSR